MLGHQRSESGTLVIDPASPRRRTRGLHKARQGPRWQRLIEGDGIGLNPSAVQHHRPRQHIAELAHVPRPRPRGELGERGLLDPCAGVQPTEQRLRDERDVGRPISKRRHRDLQDAEAVEQVFTEGSVAHGGEQVAVGRGHNAHIEVFDLGPAHAQHLARLEDPEQSGLRRE